MEIGFDLMFNIFPIIFLFFLGFFLFLMIKGVIEWSKNNKQPQIPVEAIVSSKRIKVSHSNSGEHMEFHHSNTSYYVTFEFTNRERAEFLVTGKEYGLLREGDKGILTVQGTRYISFQRK